AATREEARARSATGSRRAPCRFARRSAGNRWFLFRLQFRREAVNGKVVRYHVIGDLESAADGPFAISKRIVRESDVRPEVIPVGSWLAEDDAEGRIVRNGVQRLVAFGLRYAVVFVAQAEV